MGCVVKPLLDLADLIPGWLYALIVAGALAWGGAQTWRVHSLKSDITSIKQAQAEAVAAAEKAAREETDRLQGIVDETERKYQTDVAAVRSAADRATAQLARLRGQAASANDLANASKAALSDYAASAERDIDWCAGRLVRVGETAAGASAAAHALSGAWPRTFEDAMKLQVQTMKGTAK